MLERGVLVPHETVRRWPAKFGQAYANGLCRRRPRTGGGRRHLDVVFAGISGQQKYLWRAVDQDGSVLDILLQLRREAKAAKRYTAKLVEEQRRVLRVLVHRQAPFLRRRRP